MLNLINTPQLPKFTRSRSSTNRRGRTAPARGAPARQTRADRVVRPYGSPESGQQTGGEELRPPAAHPPARHGRTGSSAPTDHRNRDASRRSERNPGFYL